MLSLFTLCANVSKASPLIEYRRASDLSTLLATTNKNYVHLHKVTNCVVIFSTATTASRATTHNTRTDLLTHFILAAKENLLPII